LKNKKVMVTGAAGFIGSHLAEELADNNEVTIIDDLSTGKIENINQLLKRKSVKFIKGSITDYDLLQNEMKDIDYVFHQAALPSVPRSIEDPKGSNEANVTGTLNVLTAAKIQALKR